MASCNNGSKLLRPSEVFVIGDEQVSTELSTNVGSFESTSQEVAYKGNLPKEQLNTVIDYADVTNFCNQRHKGESAFGEMGSHNRPSVRRQVCLASN